MATTPDGFRLWLCPFHYAQYQPPPLRLCDFAFETFLCHNSQDKESVRKVASLLRGRGVSYWLDEEQIRGGDRWQIAMAKGLQESATVVVCIGAHGWHDWQLEEIEVALTRSTVRNSHRVVPLVLPPLAALPMDCPAFLLTRHAVVLTSFEEGKSLTGLVDGIRAH